ncbi:MAG: TRAP transporter large permease [Firmicutes bacterium]|nr:TRAP transporter large permease [Bacillota bacterium]
MAAVLVLLLFLLCFGVPVPFAFFGTSMVLVFLGGYDTSFLLPYGYTKVSSYVLLAIPLFIMAGGIIERSNMGEKLVNFIELFVGKVKGSLGVVAVVSCAVFGAITGSAAATQSVIGSIMWPRMEAAGYSKGKSAALIASSCLLGGMIPPSGLMIIYAWTAQVSVLQCFLATLVPGIIMAIMFSVAFVVMLRNDDGVQVLATGNRQEYFQLAKKRTTSAIPALLFPVIVLGGIYGGFMTATEAAAVSVVYATLVGFFIYRELKLKTLGSVLVETATTTGVIMIMLFMVMMLSRLLIMEDVPGMFLELVTSISTNKYVILIMVNIFMIIIGMLMDDVSSVLLCTPLLMPIMESIGISPIHFASIVCVNISLGCVTPPCAPLLYLASRLSNTPVSAMMKPTLLLIAFVWLPALLLVTFIPALSLTLPGMITG